MNKTIRQASIEVPKRPKKTSDELVEASKQVAAKLVGGDLNLSLELAKTAVDSYEAADRDNAKRAKAAARKGYRTILRFMPQEREPKLKQE